MKAEVKQNSAAMTVAGGTANVPLVSTEAVRVRKGYSPYIEGGYWFVYDDNAKAYVNTGVIAEGKAGADGKDGVNGKDGANGKDGQNGADGKDGAQGPQGIQGPQGKEGPQGIQGEQGPKGDTGATGPQGPQGERGPQGIQGPQGNDGAKGAKGDSYTITEADYEEIAKKVPAGSTTWEAVQDKPDTFTPSSHTHNASEVTDAARHTHSNKAILDAITKAPLTEHQSLDNCVKTNDARLTDARTPKAHWHNVSEIDGLASITFSQIGTADSYLRITDNEITYRLDNVRKSGTLPLQDDIPTDAHINDLIDAKLGVIENGSY